MKFLKSSRGEATIDATTVLLASLVVIAVFLFHLYPVFLAKQDLNTYAQELCRTAEISGRVGQETTDRERELTDNTGLSPKIEWSDTGKIQLGDTVSVTCTVTKNIGLFAGLGSIPIPISAKASGRSEVYWKK